MAITMQNAMMQKTVKVEAISRENTIRLNVTHSMQQKRLNYQANVSAGSCLAHRTERAQNKK
jgi:hypothetical protein